MNKINSIRIDFENQALNKVEYIDKMYELHQILFDYSSFLSKTGICKIEISDNKLVMIFRNSDVKMICIQGDKRIACFDSFNFLSYEEEELSMQFQLIEKGDVVFDIGGNYGWYSIHIAKKFPLNEIYTFEPVLNTFSTLKENILINNVNNVKALNLGLSKEVGEFTFYCDPNLTVNASLSNVSDNSNAIEVSCKVEVLDRFVEINNINKIDFIKCDIEGAELFALLGAKKSIIDFKPKIFIEMLRKWALKFDYHPNDIILFLKEIGYKCYIIKEASLEEILEVNELTIETNFVFLHNEKHYHLIDKLVNSKIHV
jgi:FkbM family methyltransferase